MAAEYQLLHISGYEPGAAYSVFKVQVRELISPSISLVWTDISIWSQGNRKKI